jgi:hypothetical protein
VSLKYPRILTTSESASVELNSGEVVHCWQGAHRVYMVSVGPKTSPVYVVAEVDDVKRLSESEREALILRRAVEIAAAGGRWADRL